MVYVPLDIELRASSMLDERPPADLGFLLLFWSVGDGTPGPLHRMSKCSLHCTWPAAALPLSHIHSPLQI